MGTSVEITTADGVPFTWDANSRDWRDRPHGLRYDTRRGEGMGPSSVVLRRDILRDYPDLALLNRMRFISERGDVVWDGEIAAKPSSIDDEGHMIEVQGAGLMTVAGRRPFTEVYLDASASERWSSDPPLEARASQIALGRPVNTDFSWSTDRGVVCEMVAEKDVTTSSRGECWYYPPPGCAVSAVQYKGSQDNSANMNDPTLRALDVRDESVQDTYTLILDNTVRKAELDPERDYLYLLATPTSLVHKSAPFHRRLSEVCVVGTHGLDLVEFDSDYPKGLRVTDVGRDIVKRFAQVLDPSGIETSPVVLSHLVFDAPTSAYDALIALNDYLGWELGVWEDARLFWQPANLGQIDYQVRTDDFGGNPDFAGDTADDFANGVVVVYEDLRLGRRVLYPDAYEQLRDDSPDNPANRQGQDRWTGFEVPYPCFERDALRIGQVGLDSYNRPKMAGRYSLKHDAILDGAGNPRDPRLVRASQTVSIANHPNDAPRLIAGTTWDEASSTLSIEFEGPPSRADLILGRVALARSSRGL